MTDWLAGASWVRDEMNSCSSARRLHTGDCVLSAPPGSCLPSSREEAGTRGRCQCPMGAPDGSTRWECQPGKGLEVPGFQDRVLPR